MGSISFMIPRFVNLQSRHLLRLVKSRSHDVVLPVTVLNAGLTVAIVEWLALKATADGMNLLYQPISYLPPSWVGNRGFRSNATPFTELAINPNNSVSLGREPIKLTGSRMLRSSAQLVGCATMGNRYSDNEAFFAELRNLIDTWCDRRCLRPLGIVLPAYNSFNGMTDGWGELLKALRALALVRDALLPNEQEIVASLRRAAEDAVEAR